MTARTEGRWRVLVVLGLVAAITMLAFSTLDQPAPPPDRGTAPGAQATTIETPDGIALSARVWARDPERVVIYLHEYGDDQSAWWPTAEAGAPTDPSAITFDFRGHGASLGDDDDVEFAPRDVRAVLAFASARGYQRMVLVGAGMGAAAAIEAAADAPSAAVVGLSAPETFAELRPIEAAARIADRIALMATEGDISARHSLEEFRAETTIPANRLVMLAGAEHGQAMLHGTRAEQARAAFERLVQELWEP